MTEKVTFGMKDICPVCSEVLKLEEVRILS